ncbi:hypothetical protein ACE1SV_36780 [Streptomyces sennicomposti]
MFSCCSRSRFARHTGHRPSLTGAAQFAHTNRSYVMRSPSLHRRSHLDNARGRANVPLSTMPGSPAFSAGVPESPVLPAAPVRVRGPDKPYNCPATRTGDCAGAPDSRMVTLIYPRRPVVHP